MKIGNSIAGAVLAFLAAGASHAEDSGNPIPAANAPAVYVANFELDAENIQTQKHLLPRPLAGLRKGPLGEKDPQTLARELTEKMASYLVEDLTKAGFRAQRLFPGAALPANGWLVRGVFVEVKEGNRLQRAIIGFGQGQTEMQVEAAADDLAAGTPQPLYQLDSGAKSGKMPGAIVLMNPYMAAARFVLAGHDLDRNVKKTAEDLAKKMTARIQQ